MAGNAGITERVLPEHALPASGCTSLPHHEMRDNHVPAHPGPVLSVAAGGRGAPFATRKPVYACHEPLAFTYHDQAFHIQRRRALP